MRIFQADTTFLHKKSITSSVFSLLGFLGLFCEPCVAAEQIILPEDLPECPVQRVADAILDSNDIIWVVGEQSGIYTFDLKDSSNQKWIKVSDGTLFDPSTNYYAIVEDKQGRIWVGTDNQGVIVHNGLEWQSYTIDNALLANRIYNLAVSPLTGDVGIASSGGVTVYNPNNQTWKDFTRGNGLIENQVRALAFAEDGSLWFAYACGGLTKGSVNHPSDSWQHIQAPWYWDEKGFVRQPLTPSGKGLPSNLCNDIISASGKIWTATCAGLAYSPTKGTSWRYVRGEDYLAKNEGLYNPDKSIKWEKTKPDKLLPQDYVSALAPSKQGLWLGTRDQGICNWSPFEGIIAKPVLPKKYENYEITTIINFPDGSIGFGTNGKGFGIVKNGSGKWDAKKTLKSTQQHPTPPPVPTEQQVLRLMAQAAQQAPGQNAVYLGEDWMTKGDWPGRYGNVYSLLCAGNGAVEGRYATSFIFGNRKKYLTESMYVVYQDFGINAFIGPHKINNSSFDSVEIDDDSTNINALFNPVRLTRKEGVWDDTGANYNKTWDGPDLWIRVVVPEGAHLIDLYFYNTPDNTADSVKADFYIEMRKDPVVHANLQEVQKAPRRDIEKLYAVPVLARTRVRQFSGSGVYQKFESYGQGTYWFRISKNSSPSARLNGVFISKVILPSELNPKLIIESDVTFDKILPVPPKLEEATLKNDALFFKLWEKPLKEHILSQKGQTNLDTALLYQYRRLDKTEIDKNLKEKLAWHLNILTKTNYEQFDKIMSESKSKKEKSCP